MSIESAVNANIASTNPPELKKGTDLCIKIRCFQSSCKFQKQSPATAGCRANLQQKRGIGAWKSLPQ
jgi:hypothetical protein